VADWQPPRRRAQLRAQSAPPGGDGKIKAIEDLDADAEHVRVTLRAEMLTHRSIWESREVPRPQLSSSVLYVSPRRTIRT
jgi:hypothetical protein